jgi:broad specificity phosphatase PhoE
MSIQENGKMEVFTQSLYEPGKPESYETRLKIKFRKSTAKNMKDAADRLIKFINEVKKALGK